MSWVPHFLSPGTAAIAAAVAVPSLLLLYFLKLRRREMPVSSTFLWRKAVQDLQVNAPFQRLRRNLLLLLQLLALLALIAALARPVANYTPGAGKLSVILIDRSASMSAADGPNGRTRLDEAKRSADDLVDGMAHGGQATVIAFDDSPDVVQTFTGDQQLLKRAIDGIHTTDRRTKLKLAFQLAGAQAAHIPEQNRANVKPTVYLFSDGRVEDGDGLTLDGDLKYQPIGTDTAGNLAVVSMDAKRNYDNPVQVQVFARLANFGPRPQTADVQLTVDGVVKSVTGVTLPPERWSDAAWVRAHPGEKDDAVAGKNSVQFTVDMPAAGVVRVEQVNKTNDLLAADDAAAVVVPPPKSLSVLLVTVAHDDPYLERALAAQGLANYQVMSADDYEDKRPTNFDVVLFDRYTPDWAHWPAPRPAASSGSGARRRRQAARAPRRRPVPDGRRRDRPRLAAGQPDPSPPAGRRHLREDPAPVGRPARGPGAGRRHQGSHDRPRPRGAQHEPGRRVRLAPEQLAPSPRQLPAVHPLRAAVHGPGFGHGRPRQLPAGRHADRAALGRRPPWS